MVDQDFTKSSKSLEQLDTIFQSVKQQVKINIVVFIYLVIYFVHGID